MVGDLSLALRVNNFHQGVEWFGALFAALPNVVWLRDLLCALSLGQGLLGTPWLSG